MSTPAAKAEPEPSPFERMKALAAKVISTPKAEIDRREKEWRKGREKNSRGPQIRE
jgi:hypothetical protein